MALSLGKDLHSIAESAERLARALETGITVLQNADETLTKMAVDIHDIKERVRQVAIATVGPNPELDVVGIGEEHGPVSEH